MIQDALLEFSTAQALTATAVSENVIDLGVDRDIGAGEPLELLVTVGTELDSAADGAVLTISLQTDTVENFASATVLATSAAIAEASCTAGAELFKIKIPRDTERYLRLSYAVTTEDFTSGTINAGIVYHRHDGDQYASGFTVA